MRYIYMLFAGWEVREKRDTFMKNGNEGWDVLSDSRKRYRGPWAEIGKWRSNLVQNTLKSLLIL